MPMRAELDRKSLILTFEMSGEFGRDEIESIQAITQEHARTTGGLKGMLVDLRSASPGALPSAPIRAAAARAQGFEATRELKMAIVAATDIAFGLSRMYEQLRGDDGGVRVYKDLDAALAWLGSDEPEA